MYDVVRLKSHAVHSEEAVNDSYDVWVSLRICGYKRSISSENNVGCDILL